MRERQNESEKWFESYCAQQGITVLAHEPSYLGVETRPDYLVARNGVEVLCEVKEFDTTEIDRLRETHTAFSYGDEVAHKPVRSQVREAARTLKPLAGSEWPLVVVLANPRGVHVQLNPDSLLEALYGDLTVSFPVGPDGGPVTEPTWGLGRNGRLRSDHPYISAVVALRQSDREVEWWAAWHARKREGSATTYDEVIERFEARRALAERVAPTETIPTGTYYRADVIRNWSESATPLPADFFNGGSDTLWEFDPAAGAYVRS